MKNFVWFICLAFQFFLTSSQVSTSGWTNVDCGNEAATIINGLPWSTDQDFTKVGINKRLPVLQSFLEMSTLRYFPNPSDQNCYTLPTDPQVLRYLIRAGFFYGNYDGLDNPPTFDLSIDGKKWSTVNTTSSTILPVYHEAMYATHGSSSVNVCLKQMINGEVPFISSLEMVPLGLNLFPNLYPKMQSDATYFLVNRTNFAGLEIRYTGVLSDEKHNRIWAAGPTPPIYNLVPTVPELNPQLENDPPVSVLSSSTASFNTTSPIILTVDFPPQSTSQSAYFVFYFTEMAIRPFPNDTRIVDIYINGVMKDTEVVEVNGCKVVTVYPETVVGRTVNVTLSAADSSTLPPIISAMEVFTTVDHVQDHGKSSIVNVHDPLILLFIILIHVLVVLLLI